MRWAASAKFIRFEIIQNSPYMQSLNIIDQRPDNPTYSHFIVKRLVGKYSKRFLLLFEHSSFANLFFLNFIFDNISTRKCNTSLNYKQKSFKGNLLLNRTASSVETVMILHKCDLEMQKYRVTKINIFNKRDPITIKSQSLCSIYIREKIREKHISC